MLHTSCLLLTRIWAWFAVISLSLLSPAHAQAQPSQRNLTIPSSSSQIIYTPFVCNSSTAIPDSQCLGAWQILDLDGVTFVSTNGPAPESANIIPQMFFRFRASALYLTTSALSNSTTNITVSTNGTIAVATFNSSVGVIAVLNLPEAELTTVTITYIANASPSRLDIGDLTLTVTDDLVTSILLPTPTLPPSSALPTFSIPHPSSTPSPSTQSTSSNHQLIAEGVGIVLGLSLGLTAVAVISYICWRRRRRRSVNSDSEAPPRFSRPSPPRPGVQSYMREKKTWFIGR